MKCPLRRNRSRFVSRLMRGESGEATVEFVGITMLLLIPLVYLILAFFQIQSGLYAAEAGAAGAARILTLHPVTGVDSASLAVQLAAADQGLPAGKAQYSLECVTGPCPAAGSRGIVHVSLEVPLPLVGTILQSSFPTSLTLHADHPIQWGDHGA
ncbi:Uncharacterised protein [Mobiluncus curtisii subsp. curtisii]|nr:MULTISPECIES: pilus assembly protein TadE [Mobiluncus]STY76771.1 Uncharacterised protein [Mobiluncus curtisii subsp. curtisii]STY89065.1 Uncharacterised protein [Mobiluncus holmesii]